ncbi:MAG: 3-dehydroquinate synthase, partial [Clostridiales bacterium]|nr:3-dehydroquinate synthase [Clostridiales bacterium]
MENVTVRVNTGEPYEVIIGGGLLSQCGVLISKEIKPCRAAVISDGNVMKIYGHKVISSLENEG